MSNTRTGAEVIVEHAVAERVPFAVGLCGHGDLGLLDALVDARDSITTISVHHESVAGFVADAYYRLTHQPLITFTSCGPGSANLPVALGSALMDDSAFLAITGNVATSQFNRAPFQESGRHYQADFPSVVRPYVKRSFQATRAEQLPLMMRQAFALMRSGRPGPVHLDVPLDVFVERTGVPLQSSGRWGVASGSGAAPDDVDAIAKLLAAAQRPVIVAGSGVAGSDGEPVLAELAHRLGVPVATSPLGKSCFPADDPLSLGAVGRNGTLGANRATRNSDLVLAIGTRLDDRASSSWLPGYTYDLDRASLVHIHIDALEISRNLPATLGVAASPAVVLRQLLAHPAVVRQPAWDAWVAQTQQWSAEWHALVAGERVSDAVPLRPERVLHDLRRVLPTDAVLLSDVGVHHNWVVQEWNATRPRTLLQSWGFASMGFGVGGVLGAHLARPESPCVAVVGDGGFLMFPSVVATAVEYDIPAVWVVWNNGGYVSIRDQQAAYFGADRKLATMFEHERSGRPYCADFAALATSMGGNGIRVSRPDELAPAIDAAIASRRPTVIDVTVAADVSPKAVATWELPPLPYPEPSCGWPDRP